MFDLRQKTSKDDKHNNSNKKQQKPPSQLPSKSPAEFFL